MAAPAAGSQPTLMSGAADAEYNSNLATIEHGENNLFGANYGKTGEIGGELGQQLTNLNTRTAEQVGPNFAKGELGGTLGRAQGERTKAESARAGANIQSGLYGTERANTLLGFNQRATGIERGAREGTERITNKARAAWEKDQADRANAIIKANNRYQNYVARNPGPAAVGAITAAGGGPPGSSVNTGPGSPGQPIKAGGGNMGGPTPVGGFGTPGNLGVIQVGGVRAGPPTFMRPPPKPKGKR